MKVSKPIDTERFSGVKRAYALLFLTLMEFIEELGTENSLRMLQRAIEKQADIIASELRLEMPHVLSPLDVGLTVHRRFMEDAGAEAELHMRDTSSVTVRIGRCPFYEALLDVGVDCGYFLGVLCSNLTLPAIQSTLQRFDPRFRLEAKLIRRSAEEFCLERIYLQEARSWSLSTAIGSYKDEYERKKP